MGWRKMGSGGQNVFFKTWIGQFSRFFSFLTKIPSSYFLIKTHTPKDISQDLWGWKIKWGRLNSFRGCKGRAEHIMQRMTLFRGQGRNNSLFEGKK